MESNTAYYKCPRCGKVFLRETNDNSQSYCFENLPYEEGKVVAKKVNLIKCT